jgi:hypothetical protein
MKISINTIDLKEKILKPLNRIVEDCILNISENKISSISTIDSGGIIIFVSRTIPASVSEPVDLNIKNINKLVSVLNCVTDKNVDMIIESNHIKYDSAGFKFKFHLTEDGVITKPKIKREKLENISYNTSANISINEFYSILKSSSFLNGDSVRLYFYTKSASEDRGVYCDITNKNIANSDSITVKISDDFDGDPITGDLICDVEHIRKLAVTKNSTLRMAFDSKVGYTIFDIIEENGTIRYVMPTLSK